MSSRSKKKQVGGAFGNVIRRRRFQAEAAERLTEASRQRALKRAYAEFYASAQGEEFVKKEAAEGRPKSMWKDDGPLPRHEGMGTSPDFHDPSESVHAVESWHSTLAQAAPTIRPEEHHPVKSLEPQDEHAPLGDLTRDQIDLVCDTFKHVFRWVLDGANGHNGTSPLVAVGERCNVVLAKMRPDLAHGLGIDAKLKDRFNRANFKASTLLATGDWFGRVMEWLRRGDPISARGERVYLLAYKLWPEDISARTLASLGGMNGKTRQAKDKQVNCLRDTMGGLKAITMRPDITRARCRASQLEHYEH